MASDSESSSSDEESSGDEGEDQSKIQLDLYSASAIEVQNALDQAMQQGSDPVCPSSGCETLRTMGLNYTHNATAEALRKKKWGNYTADGNWEIKNVTSSWPDDSPLFTNENATHPEPIPQTTNTTLNQSNHADQNATHGHTAASNASSNATHVSNHSNGTDASHPATTANAAAPPAISANSNITTNNTIAVVTTLT